MSEPETVVELDELDDELDELLDDELLVPPGQVVPPGSQPVPQLTVWQ